MWPAAPRPARRASWPALPRPGPLPGPPLPPFASALFLSSLPLSLCPVALSLSSSWLRVLCSVRCPGSGFCEEGVSQSSGLIVHARGHPSCGLQLWLGGIDLDNLHTFAPHLPHAMSHRRSGCGFGTSQGTLLAESRQALLGSPAGHLQVLRQPGPLFARAPGYLTLCCPQWLV